MKIQEAREFEGGPGILAYWTKGHVDPEQFVSDVLEHCDQDRGKEWYDETPYTVDDVGHALYRNVPAGREFPGWHIMMECSERGRGVYPVTEIKCWEARERIWREKKNSTDK